MTTATDTETVTFISRSPNLQIVIEPAYDLYNAAGFKRGVHPAKRVDFSDSQFTTSDPEVIEYLRSSGDYNAATVTGFYELGNAPDEPKPTIREQQAKIDAALEDFDVDALEAVIEEENATHKREGVLAPARVALRVLSRGAGGESPSSTSQP